MLDVFSDELSGYDWERRCEAISLANRLVCHHPKIVLSHLRPVRRRRRDVPGFAQIRGIESRTESREIDDDPSEGGQFDGEIECVLPSVMKRAIEMSFLSAGGRSPLHNIVECTEPRAE